MSRWNYRSKEEESFEKVWIWFWIILTTVICISEAYGPPDRPNPSSRETQEVVD